MIIKLVPVKRGTGTIGRVVNYIAKDKGRIGNYRKQGVFHNLIGTELEAIEKEFEQNYTEYAVQRSNGNIGMHCILSLSPFDRKHATIAMMDDLVRTYLDRAFPQAIAFAAHHKEEEHWHSHVLVSANKLMSKEGTRLSKQDLKEIQQDMLDYMQERYPALSQGIDMDNWGKRLQNERAYYKQKRNPELELTKDKLAETIQEVFRASESSHDFYMRLEKAGYRTYYHKGEVKGVLWQSGEVEKKMRFSRLGLHDKMRIGLDKQNARLQELEDLRSRQASERMHEQRQMPDIKTASSPDGEAKEQGSEQNSNIRPQQQQNHNLDRR